jgi:hypothetical protein
MRTFKDFHPAVLVASGLLRPGAYDGVAATVRTADEWLKETRADPSTWKPCFSPARGPESVGPRSGSMTTWTSWGSRSSASGARRSNRDQAKKAAASESQTWTPTARAASSKV